MILRIDKHFTVKYSINMKETEGDRPLIIYSKVVVLPDGHVGDPPAGWWVDFVNGEDTNCH